jgi:hypothetical protein
LVIDGKRFKNVILGLAIFAVECGVEGI